MFLVVPTLQLPGDGEQGQRRGYISKPREGISKALQCSLKPKIARAIPALPVVPCARREMGEGGGCLPCRGHASVPAPTVACHVSDGEAYRRAQGVCASSADCARTNDRNAFSSPGTRGTPRCLRRQAALQMPGRPAKAGRARTPPVRLAGRPTSGPSPALCDGIKAAGARRRSAVRTRCGPPPRLRSFAGILRLSSRLEKASEALSANALQTHGAIVDGRRRLSTTLNHSRVRHDELSCGGDGTSPSVFTNRRAWILSSCLSSLQSWAETHPATPRGVWVHAGTRGWCAECWEGGGATETPRSPVARQLTAG
jgi:hypothetical protein